MKKKALCSNRYGAGQKPFGILLGLGESIINTYEQGNVPRVANSPALLTEK
jgi:hypothetical protein